MTFTLPDWPWYVWIVLYVVGCFVWGFCEAAAEDVYDHWRNGHRRVRL